MIEKSWYQVKNIENVEMYHKGQKLKPKQLIYLTKEQASLHNSNGENLVESEAPKTVLDAAFALEFNEYNDLKKPKSQEKNVAGKP
jgi:hypothetical protein